MSYIMRVNALWVRHRHLIRRIITLARMQCSGRSTIAGLLQQEQSELWSLKRWLRGLSRRYRSRQSQRLAYGVMLAGGGIILAAAGNVCNKEEWQARRVGRRFQHQRGEAAPAVWSERKHHTHEDID